MTTFYPVGVTVAFFIAVILHDVFTRSKEKIAKHMLTALVVILLMIYLSFKDLEIVSWGVLLVPFTILVICYFLAPKSTEKASLITGGVTPEATTGSTATNNPSHVAPNVATNACPVAASGEPSVLSTPSSPSMTTALNGNTYTTLTSCNMA
jgi:hypothetical protein